jgi:hypothetical protein
MASKTIEFGAIDQTAEPLSAKIAPTEPAISIGYVTMRFFMKDSKEKFADASFSRPLPRPGIDLTKHD